MAMRPRIITANSPVRGLNFEHDVVDAVYDDQKYDIKDAPKATQKEVLATFTRPIKKREASTAQQAKKAPSRGRR